MYNFFPPALYIYKRSQFFFLLKEPHHEREVSAFLQDHGSLYLDVKFIWPEEEMDDTAARNMAL